jgi:hypothetical protein
MAMFSDQQGVVKGDEGLAARTMRKKFSQAWHDVTGSLSLTQIIMFLHRVCEKQPHPR